MVVGGEKRPGSDPVAIGQILSDGPRNAESIEGAGAPSDLIQDDQAPGRGVVEDSGGLGPFPHEGTVALPHIVRGAGPPKDPVPAAHRGRPGPDEPPPPGPPHP